MPLAGRHVESRWLVYDVLKINYEVKTTQIFINSRTDELIVVFTNPRINGTE